MNKTVPQTKYFRPSSDYSRNPAWSLDTIKHELALIQATGSNNPLMSLLSFKAVCLWCDIRQRGKA